MHTSLAQDVLESSSHPDAIHERLSLTSLFLPFLLRPDLHLLLTLLCPDAP